MNSLLPLRCIFFSVWVGFTFSSSGAVYQNSFGVGRVTGQPGVNYAIGATTQPGNTGDGAGLLLFVDSNLLMRPIDGTAGIGHAWYKTLDGRVIDPAFVAANSPFAQVTNIVDFSGQIQLTLGGTFLLGFWLEASGDNIPGPGDRFGWARLRYTAANGLTLVDNAIESTGAGIIAGTTTAVPEPSPSLLLSALLGLGLSRRLRLEWKPS